MLSDIAAGVNDVSAVVGGGRAVDDDGGVGVAADAVVSAAAAVVVVAVSVVVVVVVVVVIKGICESWVVDLASVIRGASTPLVVLVDRKSSSSAVS
jgi:hypothetical protein